MIEDQLDDIKIAIRQTEQTMLMIARAAGLLDAPTPHPGAPPHPVGAAKPEAAAQTIIAPFPSPEPAAEQPAATSHVTTHNDIREAAQPIIAREGGAVIFKKFLLDKFNVVAVSKIPNADLDAVLEGMKSL